MSVHPGNTITTVNNIMATNQVNSGSRTRRGGRVLAVLQRAFSSSSVSSTTTTTAAAADGDAEARKPTSSAAKGLKGAKSRKSRKGDGVPSLVTRPSLPDDVVTGYGRGKVEEGIVRSWAVRGEMEMESNGRATPMPEPTATKSCEARTPTQKNSGEIAETDVEAGARGSEYTTPAVVFSDPFAGLESQLDVQLAPGRAEEQEPEQGQEQEQPQSTYDWDAFKRERVEKRNWFRSGEGYGTQVNESVVAVVGEKKRVLRRRTRTRKGE